MCSGRSGASCRYEGKTKGNIGVLMHVLPLVFAVAAATCWEKHGAARFVYDTFGGCSASRGRWINRFGNRDPLEAPPPLTICLLSQTKAKIQKPKNPKTETCNNGHKQKKGREASSKLTLIRFPKSAGVLVLDTRTRPDVACFDSC